MMKFLTILFLMTNCLFGQTNSKLSQPENDFEIFWTTFNDNYCFFDLKKVNWDSTYLKFKPMVSGNTREEELITVFKQMVEPLKDGHVTILKGDSFIYNYRKPSYFKEEFRKIENELWTTSFKTLNDNEFSEVTGIGPIERNENLYYFSQSKESDI